MYDEDSFKATLLWLRIRKVFIMLFFTLLFFAIGFAVSEYLVDIIGLDSFIRAVAIAGATLLGFSIGFVLTANVEYKIQTGYYSIAVLRKLSVISKKLDKFDDEELEKIFGSSNIKEVIKNPELPINVSSTSNVNNKNSLDTTRKNSRSKNSFSYIKYSK